MHEYRTADGIDELQAATGSVARVLARLYTLGAFTVLLTRARTGLCHTTHITLSLLMVQRFNFGTNISTFSQTADSVIGSILKYVYFKEYFKYMLSILQCILNTFVVFVI